MTGLLAQAAAPVASGPQLIIAALLGIAVIVLLITRFSVHPFLALTIGSLVVGAVAGMALDAAITSFSNGFGSTAASVGTLIALGAMFGKLLADSGGADQIVDTIVGRSSTRTPTVATVTAPGILAPLVATLDPGTTSLLVLAIGTGSLFFSHVNDAGFWLVKEYFGITVGQTLRTWSVMETLISVVGLIFVLLLGLVV